MAKSYMEGSTKDVDKALALLDEADSLEKEFDAEKRLADLAKAEAIEKARATSKVEKSEDQAEITKAFLKGVRKRFKDYNGMREGVDAEGGYVVPQDIVTQINHFKKAEFSLLPLVDYNQVTTNKGSRTYESKATATAFGEMDEAGVISQIENINFQPIKFSIRNYGGFLPVTNQLLQDTDAALQQTISQWFARKSVATSNKLILDILKSKGEVVLGGLTDIKKALNVTLGQAYLSSSVVLTNDSGLNYLDSLKDENGRYILNPNPTEPTKLQLRAGAVVVPIKVVPNNVLPTEDNKIPFIIGDMKEAVAFWDRQQYILNASDIASVGNVNAFAQNLTLFRTGTRDRHKGNLEHHLVMLSMFGVVRVVDELDERLQEVVDFGGLLAPIIHYLDAFG